MLGGVQTVGPATFTRWSGFYFGGQVGYSNGNADFSGATQPGLAFALRNTFLENQFQPSRWQVLGTANSTALGYGGLLGYNTQWQDLIVGVEGNVNRTQLTLNAPSLPLGRTTGADGAGNAYTLQLSGTGTIANMDVFTARLRAGYVL